MLRRVTCGVLLVLAGIVLGSWGTSRMLPTWAAAAPLPGDVNGDGQLNLTDPVLLLNFLFQGGPAPTACPSCPPPPSLALKTIVLVRHAEKTNEGGEDAHLTDAGKIEAEKLKEVFKDVAVDFIAASTKPRTIETVQPLADRVPASPIPIAMFGDTTNYDGLIDFISGTPANTLTVIAHHSTTLKKILRELGAPEAQFSTIDTNAYNNLIVVFLQAGGPTIALPLRGQDLKAFPVCYFGPPQ